MASSSTTGTILEQVISHRESVSRSEVPDLGLAIKPKNVHLPTVRTHSIHESDAESRLEGGRRLDEFEVSDDDLRNGTIAVQSFSNPPMNRWRMLSVCLIFIGNGINDSAAGVLILYMEKTYNIGYAIVSIIFITTAFGFIFASLFTDSLTKKLGSSKTLALAEFLKCIAYSSIAPITPYPVVCVAFFFIGCAMSLELGIGIFFATNLANGTTMLGFATGAYGLGGIIGPLIATSLTSHGVLWARFYLINLAFAVFNGFLAPWAFWTHEKDSQAFLPPPTTNNAPITASKLGTMKKALKNKVTLLSAFFIFVYQGAEVAISGWVISYLITYRHGDPAHVGYVTAGFWGGITLGRFVLTKPLSAYLGEKKANYVLISGSIIFEALAWGVPNIVGDAVAVCIVGILMAPIYPIACNTFMKLLPKDIQIASISLIQGMGSSGGAALPFLTGVLAQVAGTYVVHPIVLGAFALTLGTWFLLPDISKREE